MLIKTLKNQTIFLPNKGIVNIVDIKRKIFDITGYPIITQKLFSQTKLLEDDKNINYYNLSDISTIEMSFALNGGGKGATHNRGRHENYTTKRDLVLAKEGETVYAIVKSICGNKRVIVIRIDNGTTVMGRISGSIHAWIKKDDVVLVGLRDFQEDKVDVVWRYTTEEARKLSRAGYIPQNIVVDKNIDCPNNTASIEFLDMGVNIESEQNKSLNNYDYSRRYEMPSSSDEDTENEEQEEKSNTENDFKKNNDDFNIDNI
jgi:translation initiation factor 1A